MSSTTKLRSTLAALMAGVSVVSFCFFGDVAAELYSFVTKWPNVPEAWRFAAPHSVAVDSSGNVFVADTGNHRVQKFDPSGNLLATWGSHGTEDGQFSSPEGIAVDLSGNVFVVDTENYRVQKFDASGNFIHKWGSRGSGDGEFWGGGYGGGPGPVGIAADAWGNIFVADTENHRIQKFDSSGSFLGKWGSYGTGDGNFSSPHGIAVDSQTEEAFEKIFVTDTGNHRIQKFDAAGNYLRKWGFSGTANGQFSYPCGIAVNPSGSLFVLDTANERVQEFDLLGNLLAVWGSRGSGDGQFGGLPEWSGSVEGPRGIALDTLGNIFVADTRNDRIQKFDPAGNFLTKWAYKGAADGEFDKPAGIAVLPLSGEASEDLVVVDTGNRRIQKFDASGSYLAKWGQNGTANGEFSWPFVWPPGVAADSSGNIFVADTGNNRIQKFDSEGNFLGKWGYYDPEGGGAPLQPYGVAVNSGGNVLVTDAERCWIVEFDSVGNFVTKWGALGTGDGQFNQPRGIAVGPFGSVFIADTGNHRIQKFDAVGNFLTTWGTEGEGDGQFRRPYAVAVDSLGNAFVADTGNHRVQEFDPSGNFVTKWGSQGFADGEFEEPHGIALDSNGNVYISDTGNHRIQKFERLQPEISLQPDSLDNTCEEGMDAVSQSFEVWNSAAATLSYTVSEDVSWLSCDPPAGSSSGETETVAVIYTTSELEVGIYYATITVSDPAAMNSPQEIDVTLTVRPKIVAIGYQPTSIYSFCDQGHNALSKNFEVWNAGAETLSYTITDDVAWLFCIPSSGTSTGEHDTVKINYNTAGLEPGTYVAKITVSDLHANNNPQHIGVTLTVRPGTATIGCQPASLRNACDQGEDARSQGFEVWNSGGGTLYYAVEDDADWLSCSPASGTSTGEHDTVRADYHTSALAPGDYSASITVSDPDASNGPQTIGVSLTVHPITPNGTLRAGSTTATGGDMTPFPVTISLDLPYDLTSLAMTVGFRADLFDAVHYEQAGRVADDPAADGINNTTGEVRLVWLSLAGETLVPAGSGEIATIHFQQNVSVGEGTYPVTLSDIQARYGPEEYHLELANGAIEIVRGSLDVDGDGEVEPATDIVYIHRYLVEMPTTVPSQFREIDPSIPPDEDIESRIDDVLPFLDVDASGSDPDPGTDIVYIYRYLVGMPTTVPTSFRDIDPSIPPDEEINLRIAAINVGKPLWAPAPEHPLAAAPAVGSPSDALRIAQAGIRAGTSFAVPLHLDAPGEDLSYLRLWIEYDRTKVIPRELLKAGRTSLEPMPDWLDKNGGRIRAIVESLEGEVVIPKGTGSILEIVFDVLQDTTTSDALHILGEVEAGFGPKKVPVAVVRPVTIAPGANGAVHLAWEPFGGGLYTVLYSENLLGGDWLPVEGTDWPTGETSWQAEPPADVKRRFYRVKSE